MTMITMIMVKDVENATIVILTFIWPLSLTRGGSKDWVQNNDDNYDENDCHIQWSHSLPNGLCVSLTRGWPGANP